MPRLSPKSVPACKDPSVGAGTHFPRQLEVKRRVGLDCARSGSFGEPELSGICSAPCTFNLPMRSPNEQMPPALRRGSLTFSLPSRPSYKLTGCPRVYPGGASPSAYKRTAPPGSHRPGTTAQHWRLALQSLVCRAVSIPRRSDVRRLKVRLPRREAGGIGSVGGYLLWPGRGAEQEPDDSALPRLAAFAHSRVARAQRAPPNR